MTDPIDRESLDPETRCYAEVGHFLQEWALMEFRLRNAITKALGLTAMQGIIVASNAQLRDKLNVLRVSLDYVEHLSPDDIAAYKKLLTRIANYAPTRNMFAHDMFMETKDGKGVEFYVVKARNTLTIPPTVWTWKKFERERSTVFAFTFALTELVEKLKTPSSQGLSSIARAFLESAPPSPGPEYVGLLTRLIQSAPDSSPHQANPETEPQTPPTKPE